MSNDDVLSAMSRRSLLATATAAGAAAASSASAASPASTADQPAMPNSNFGKGADDKALRAAWKQFCRRLEDAGDRVFKGYNPTSPMMRADGFRFLQQNLGQAFMLAYETKDPKYPFIHTFCSPFLKLGGDNADCVYQQAWVDGESVYKISGNRGTARFFNIAVQGPRRQKMPGSNWRPLHEPFGDTPEANIFGHQIETDWNGNFEIYIGGPKRGPNWAPTTSGTRKLFIRQYFDAWSEEPARMVIERVGMTEPRPIPKPADMENAMDWAGRFVEQMMIDWPDWGVQFMGELDPKLINVFPKEPRAIKDPVYTPEKDKLRGRSINGMDWKLAPDEALIIEWDKNDLFWMLTNMGVFRNSMDYLYRPVSYTPARTKVDSDGKVRMVMAHKDPGYHNWIDTQGFEIGSMIARNILTTKFTEYRTQVVKHAELAKHMPGDSAKVTPEERNKLMLERFHAIQRRYFL